MPRIRLTPEERRERNRLRSERWRRAHGIGPRKPAQRPWLAEGISKSTWYRRRAKAREQAALGAQGAQAAGQNADGERLAKWGEIGRGRGKDLTENNVRSNGYGNRAQYRADRLARDHPDIVERLTWQLADLRESLDRAAACNAIIGEVLREPLPLIW